MNRTLLSIAILGSILLSAGAALAQDDPVERVMTACETEITNYCSQVTPGEGRLLACFVAHEDKISGQCSYAVYQSMAELDAFINALAYVASSCEGDILEHCGEVELGEGRVASCLLDHKEEVTAECKQAMEDVELEMVDE